MTNNKTIKSFPAWLLISAAVFVSLIFIIVITGWYFNEQYQARIAPGVKVAGVSLGGKTIAEAQPVLQEILGKLDDGIPVKFNQKTVNIAAQKNILSPDSFQPLVFLDSNSTLNNAFLIGHSNNELLNAWQKVNSYFFGNSIDISMTVDREAIVAQLKKDFSDQENKPTNASVNISKGQTTIVKEKTGILLNYDKAASDIINQLHLVKVDPIIIESRVVEPTVLEADVQANLSAVEAFLVFPKTKLVYETNSWDLDTKKASQWLAFSKVDNNVEVILDQEKIKQFLTDEIVPKVNHDPVQARLSMTSGRASVWQAGAEGVAIDLDKTAASIAAWPKEKPATIEISVNKTPAGANDVNAEELGLKEIIGTGISNFAGSPANRRHNIKVGAAALNGLLIKPGEEFSLLRALGRIDGSTGYLQELVIKENKTIPEFGGGLCQIGTTLFRTTFNSGLPVTQRRNHSYRVVYYEPAGTDATIYDPAPDYRFVNDTGKYILIQTRIVGNQAIFDFWGTKDGRQINIGKPVIYNIVAPAPTKTIETTTLKEGEKKCTEKAHNGADAYFDYKVTYPSGEEKAVRFSSHYVPWQAVCLVGAKKLPDTIIPPVVTPTVSPVVSPVAN
ncbi:MAG: VanW family protein [Candidatus Falkowbacteria bacterium]|nr:VanW family protein [Candidatus Falkowbacteria bacterium]